MIHLFLAFLTVLLPVFLFPQSGLVSSGRHGVLGRLHHRLLLQGHHGGQVRLVHQTRSRVTVHLRSAHHTAALLLVLF